MRQYRKHITAAVVDILNTAGVEFIIEIEKGHQGSEIEPPVPAQAKILEASIMDKEKFITTYLDTIGVHKPLWKKIENELDIQSSHFGKTTQIVVFFNGVKFTIQTVSGKIYDAKIIDAEITNEKEFIANLPKWVCELVSEMAQERN